ncbi:MAG TPA: fused MFS/spermidine synthase [Myxococcaceae bacterium]|nr:fused MFS/spermidine synthase [Myxococcaceae bacterium]
MSRIFRLAPLLFLSGACALVYQAAWMREFRLIFGASTLASAAVTAIFMGGLGLGSWWGGRYVDRHRAPLLLYGNLELVVASSAALTPLLVPAVRAVYVGIGGSLLLGEVGASVVRLLLSALVLAVPTLAMGATLPAIISAAANAAGDERRPVGWLYGANTLGAVFGTLLATFVLIEIYGIRQTLWMAALVNGLVGLVGRVLSRSWPGETREPVTAARVTGPVAREQRVLVVAAGVVGLVFFLMEMVWYRLLSPVLGGSTFTFGLILALALLGIAIGGALHSLLASEEGGSPSTLAVTCLLEAFFLALPFAFADDLAILAALLRSLAAFGLSGLAFGWSIVASAIIVPAAIVAGYQFPLLISLLRPRVQGIGSAVALGYGANTLGSIAGALLGGFGLLRLLSAPGTWRVGVALLVAMAVMVVALVGDRRPRARWRGLALAIAAASAVGVMTLAPGPSAVWRHSGIGVGRAHLLNRTPNEVEDWANLQRRFLLWETDGVESSVALTTLNDLAFVVNGKSDGSAIGDSGTQVMSGLLAAITHPRPRRSLVIGLGTGTTAGWLAAIPEMERVDVIEIEPAIVEVARRAAMVNQNVLANPKIHLVFRDAREVLLASNEKYDLIFSEPSNPYRLGIASLFSQEFYRAVRARLNPDGVLIQWMQAYSISAETLRTVMATLADSFADVETWRTDPGDLVFAARAQHPVHDVSRLGSRAASEPFRSALEKTWHVEGVEGYFAYFVAGDGLVRAVAAEEQGEINTDDHPILEFGFARGIGRSFQLTVEALRRSARAIGADRPAVVGRVDWERVEQIRMEEKALTGATWQLPPGASEATRRLNRLLLAWRGERVEEAERELQPMLGELRGPIEYRIATEILGRTGAPQPESLERELRARHPLLTRALAASRTFDSGDRSTAAREVESVLRDVHAADPWSVEPVVRVAGPLALAIATKEPARAPAFLRAVQQPFPVFRSESLRHSMLVSLADLDPDDCLVALRPQERFPRWTEETLTARVRCYERKSSPLQPRAREDLARFRTQEGSDFHLGESAGQSGLQVSTRSTGDTPLGESPAATLRTPGSDDPERAGAQEPRLRQRPADTSVVGNTTARP